MRVLANDLGGISGVINQDFLRGDRDVDSMAIGFHVKRAIRRELQEVQAGQVASRIIEEHVFAARIAGIDASRVLDGVPAVDGGIVLHTRISAMPRGFRNFPHQVFRFVSIDNAAIDDSASGEVGIPRDCDHEVVGDANRVVRVLKEDRAVGVGVRMRSVVSVGNEGMRFGFFFALAIDEVNDIRVIDIEDDHLRRTARLAAGLDDSRKSVKALHEAKRAARGASTAKNFSRRAQGRKIRACA